MIFVSRKKELRPDNGHLQKKMAWYGIGFLPYMGYGKKIKG